MFDLECSTAVPANGHASEVYPSFDVAKTATRRRLGAYYTPHSAADYMADWIVRAEGEHILEPSFGDGIFLRAIGQAAHAKKLGLVSISGIEINPLAQQQIDLSAQAASVNVRCDDFLSVEPFKVHAAIGNPPYVRLRQLPDAQRSRAMQTAKTASRQEMDPSGSLWMPFVLHTMRFLEQRGRLAFVLPYEFTYVRYARPLWNALRKNFGSLTVLRTHERLFPELLQDVVILLADDYGARTDAVCYQAFEKVQDLLSAKPVVNETLAIDALLRGERVFISALLDKPLRHLLNTRIAEASVPARELVTFNIGYVSGDKTFFHPTKNQTQQYDIPASSLRPALTSGRAMKGVGLKTAALAKECADHLFLPDPAALTTGEQNYIALGAAQGVSQRYKCRVRDPWFVVPGVRVPDVVFSVFSECPVLMVNDARLCASNSLLCGYGVGERSENVAAAWYTSLTLLQCELEIHALGGGVMVMVPQEAGNIRLPRQVRACQEHLCRINNLLRSGKIKSAYLSGDEEVLVKQLGLSADDVMLIRQGIDVLAHWRTSARSSLPRKHQHKSLMS